MRTTTSIFLGLALLTFATTSFAQEPDQVGQALDRLGTHPPPPAYGEDEAAETRRLRKLLADKRRAILTDERDPTDEELAAASAEMRPAYDRLRKLNTQRRQWEAYQADPAGEWWHAAEPSIPELVAAEPANEAPIDVFRFHLLAKRLQVLEYFLAAPNASLQTRHGYPAPSVEEAVTIARDFEPFEQGRIEVGGAGGAGSYRLRAGYLRGRALILGAYQLLDQGRMDDARNLWRQGIEVLHQVERVFKVAQQTGVDTGPLAHLPAVDEALLARLREAQPTKFIPLNWDERTHRLGLAPGGWTDSNTATETARLLENVCPWSPPVANLLEDLGQMRGIDLRVLRGPEIGTQSRNTISIDDPRKVWIHTMGPEAMPPNVARDLEELRNGIVPDHDRYLEWRSIQGLEDLTVWVVSPRVRDMQASEFLGYVSKAVTIYGCGAIAILADLAGDVLGAAADAVLPGNTPAKVAIGVGAESVPYELVWDKDGVLSMRRESFNPVGMLKGGLLSILGAVEKAEVEALFDGLDPTSDSFDERTNRSLSYQGGWVPPVILRAVVAGWEKTEPIEYPRLRVYTRYWVLDPAGLTGEGQAFDLQTQLVDELPGAAPLRAGNAKFAEQVWKPLPWAKTPNGWGSRARTASLQPMVQTLDVQVTPKLEQEWRADCPEGQDLCVVLRHAPPFQDRVDVVKLGTPFRFCDPWYARQEGLPLGHDPARIFAAYDAHIVRARWKPGNDAPHAGTGHRGPIFDVDAAEAVELANFPLRLTSRKGMPVTGKVDADDDGLEVKLTYVYEGRTRREFDLDPDPTAAPLLPPVLEFMGPYRDNTEIYEIHWAADRFKFSAAYAPAEAKTWYRLDVRVVGNGGNHDQRYSFNDYNRDVGGAAVFHGRIYVPIGSSEVRLSMHGTAEPVTHVAVVEREPTHKSQDVDLQSTQKYVDRRLANRERADDQQDWLYNHCEYLSNKMSLVDDYCNLEQWGNARMVLNEVAREWPDVNRMQSESLRDKYHRRQYTYFDYLAKVAFHQGDAEAMGPAGANMLSERWKWTERDIEDHGNPEYRYGKLEELYREFLDDYLSLGGGEAFEHLLGRWKELRRLSGRARPEDAIRFEIGGNN